MLRELLSEVGNKSKYLNKSQEIASLIQTGQRTTLSVGPILHLVGDSLCSTLHCMQAAGPGLPRTLLSLPSSCSERLCLLLCQIVVDSGDLSLALYTYMTITVLTSHLSSPCILWILLSLCWHIWAMLAFSVRRFSLSFTSKLNDTLCQKLLSVPHSTSDWTSVTCLTYSSSLYSSHPHCDLLESPYCIWFIYHERC